MPDVKLLQGDCLAMLPTLASGSVDAIVTDPPYGIGFMGKEWDGPEGIAFRPEIWRECLRVLKPGGHLLAFGGTRMHHRLTVAIEDAGFEIRDMIAWVYGTGFPKSLDVSKAIDKAAGAEREVLSRRSVAVGFDVEGQGGGGWSAGEVVITAPATDAARQWEGWGTALKPALEPITLARKPLQGTVAANVLKHGTGALNIDGCRVPSATDYTELKVTQGGQRSSGGIMNATGGERGTVFVPAAGRFPANLIHDGSDEVEAAFPTAPGQQGASSDAQRSRANCYGATSDNGKTYAPRSDTGSASRFFYSAKASKADRDAGLEDLPEVFVKTKSGGGAPNEGREASSDGGLRRNTHPTVKPTALMRYLCRLITPPGGTILDPFMGSGSTGRGAALEGFGFIGIEQSAEYHAIAERRIAEARTEPAQPMLFAAE